MSEQNEVNTRLKIEDDLIAALSGDNLKNALAYVDFMMANGLAHDIGDTTHFENDGDYVCQICINPIGYRYAWSVCMGGWDSVPCRSEYQNFPIDEDIKEFALAHVRPCTYFTSNGKECGCGFQPGRRVTLFGNEFYHTCHGGVEFGDLSGESLELAKRLTDVWKQMMDDAAKKDIPYVPKENEWLSVEDIGAHTGRPLGKAYAKSLCVQFYITPRHRYATDSTIGFSGGGWVPTDRKQIPIALCLGASSRDRFQAFKGPNEGWRNIETLKYQANVTYFVELTINIIDNTYSATAYMLDASGKPDTPYCIAKDFPFRQEGGIPPIKAIDTIYLGPAGWWGSYSIQDFKIVCGE